MAIAATTAEKLGNADGFEGSTWRIAWIQSRQTLGESIEQGYFRGYLSPHLWPISSLRRPSSTPRWSTEAWIYDHHQYEDHRDQVHRMFALLQSQGAMRSQGRRAVKSLRGFFTSLIDQEFEYHRCLAHDASVSSWSANRALLGEPCNARPNSNYEGYGQTTSHGEKSSRLHRKQRNRT